MKEKSFDSLPEFLSALFSAMASAEEDDEIEITFDDDDDEEYDELPFMDFSGPCGEDEDEEEEEDGDLYCVPAVESVIFSGPATTVIWEDGEKTTVKLAEGQEYDRYAGFTAAVCKRLFGSTSEVKRIMNECDATRRMLEREKEKEERRAREAEQAAKKTVKRVLPSYQDFNDRLNQRVVDKVIDRMADDMYGKISERVLQDILNDKQKE